MFSSSFFGESECGESGEILNSKKLAMLKKVINSSILANQGLVSFSILKSLQI